MRPSILNLACVFLVLFSSSFSPSLGDPRISEAGILCLKSNVTSVSNFLNVMLKVLAKVTEDRWANDSVTSPLPEIYALAQCHGDLSHDDCILCFAQSRTTLSRCTILDSKGRLYLDGCFIRSDYYNFFNETIDPQHDMVKCANQSSVSADQQVRQQFATKVDRVLTNVSAVAPENKGFAVFGEARRGGVAGVYALAQCWNTLDKKGCRECLANAMIRARNCTPGDEGRAMNAGCFMRYSTQRFYTVPTDGDSLKLGIIIAIALSVAAATSLLFVGAYVGYRKLSKKREVQKKLFGVPAIVRKSNLNFNYESLEKATDFFDESRKLGQGGAGSVYEGILPDGRVVAVKRLVFNTRQWVDDFFNEVNLISGIQHKNWSAFLVAALKARKAS